MRQMQDPSPIRSRMENVVMFDHPDGDDWKIGSDVFSAQYYLIDCVIKQWGAIEDAEEIILAAREAIDSRFPRLEAAE